MLDSGFGTTGESKALGYDLASSQGARERVAAPNPKPEGFRAQARMYCHVKYLGTLNLLDTVDSHSLGHRVPESYTLFGFRV